MAERATNWKTQAHALLDVRPELEQSGEPFVRIMEAASSIKPGGTLVIVAPFEPVSLYPVLEVSIAVLALVFLFYWLVPILLGGGVLIATAWLFAHEFRRMFCIRHRKLLDVIQYQSIASVIYFCLVVPAEMASVAFGWRQPAALAVLGQAALVGWLGQSIIGYLNKIVPFLIWHTRYGPLVGREKVPLMRELVHERWAWLSWWLINGGLVGVILSALFSRSVPLQITSGLLGAGFVLAAVNSVGVVLHLRKHFSPVHHE